jgi:hypothetical protein
LLPPAFAVAEPEVETAFSSLFVEGLGWTAAGGTNGFAVFNPNLRLRETPPLLLLLLEVEAGPLVEDRRGALLGLSEGAACHQRVRPQVQNKRKRPSITADEHATPQVKQNLLLRSRSSCSVESGCSGRRIPHCGQKTAARGRED